MANATNRKLSEFTPDARNANKHTPRGMSMLEQSLRNYGAGRSILVDKNGKVIAGNATIETAVDIGLENAIVVPTDGKQLVVVQRTDIDLDSKAGRELAIADNRVAAVDLDWDADALNALAAEGVDLSQFWHEDELAELLAAATDTQQDSADTKAEQARRTLAERFLVPPFSVLDARQGYWQKRKQAWLALGIQSELGRGNENIGMSRLETTSTIDFYAQKRKLEDQLGGELTKDEAAALHHQRGSLVNDRAGNIDRIRGRVAADGSGGNPLPLDRQKNGKLRAATYGAAGRSDEVSRKILAANLNTRQSADLRSNINGSPPLPTRATGTGVTNMATGTSIFDPVLCELAYRWFCPPSGLILDPFAGGSVRGIVAHVTERRYVGVDLRSEQIAANDAQAELILPNDKPRWIVGDSRNLKTIAANAYDFIFSCPPYFDLEIYSDDVADLSNAGDYERFIESYREIVRQSVDMLQDNRFACFTVGDVRDKHGMYRNFVSDTIAAFQDAGMKFYNEAILVTVVGSLPIRVGRIFESGRKLGKTHQNVLVFVKGDPRKAVEACGGVEVYVPENITGSDQPDGGDAL